jgi:hypothetical protein
LLISDTWHAQQAESRSTEPVVLLVFHAVEFIKFLWTDSWNAVILTLLLIEAKPVSTGALWLWHLTQAGPPSSGSIVTLCTI